jgi:hypothetical protein
MERLVQGNSTWEFIPFNLGKCSCYLLRTLYWSSSSEYLLDVSYSLPFSLLCGRSCSSSHDWLFVQNRAPLDSRLSNLLKAALHFKKHAFKCVSLFYPLIFFPVEVLLMRLMFLKVCLFFSVYHSTSSWGFVPCLFNNFNMLSSLSP